MLYTLVSLWLMTRVVADSSNMESNVYPQTEHQSFSPNLPYSHTNLVSGSMFISVNYHKKLNILFQKSYFFHTIKTFPWKSLANHSVEFAFSVYLRHLSHLSQKFGALIETFNYAYAWPGNIGLLCFFTLQTSICYFPADRSCTSLIVIGI